MRGGVVPAIIAAVFLGLIGLNLAHMQFSVQVQSVRAEVEGSPLVTDALGAPASVAIWDTIKMERYTLRNSDTEVLNLRTTVHGSRAEGELSMTVQNVDDQGWAGTYEVRTTSEERLEGGRYVSDPVRVLALGTFAPDGRARPPVAPPPEE